MNFAESMKMRVASMEAVRTKALAVVACIGATVSSVVIEQNSETSPQDLQAGNGLVCARYLSGNPANMYNGSRPGNECASESEQMAARGALGLVGLAASVAAGGVAAAGVRRNRSSRQGLAAASK